jgi:hypothetical protein
MRRFIYCKVVLTTSLVWVLVDVFLLLYFSECNKCDDRKDHSLLPALRGEPEIESTLFIPGGEMRFLTSKTQTTTPKAYFRDA